MYYSIRHLTTFRYSSTISQSIMEVRMQPLSEGLQRAVAFELSTTPRARVLHHRDHLGNVVHHFDIPGPHQHLEIIAKSVVSVDERRDLPEEAPGPSWEDIDAMAALGGYWDMLTPSKFARPSPMLKDLAIEAGADRNGDPLTVLRRVTAEIHRSFTYCPSTTTVDSHIEEALEARRGVCQDFSHIMIALVRDLGIPCRYVSGYLFHRSGEPDRSDPDATHAWVEALLPGLGWVGFDPTNNLLAGGRHIRVAVGRDYSDVPPTRGVFKGDAVSELEVAVDVSPCEPAVPDESLSYLSGAQQLDSQQQQQQQQQ